jgi:transketolase
MGGASNGIAYHRGFIPYCATFLTFSDYMRGSVRLAALSGLHVTYVWTHDSVGLGEDGPTHQPVEHYAALRAIPNLDFVRPRDANETAAAWAHAVERTDGPVALALTRQNLPILEGVDPEKVAKGAYVIWDNGPLPEVMFIASGSEVALCVDAAKKLADLGRTARVVSMPCRELFEAQPLSYRESVIPGTCEQRVIVEAGVKFGWERYQINSATTRYVTLDKFGASGPYKELAAEFGFTADNVLAKARELV